MSDTATTPETGPEPTAEPQSEQPKPSETVDFWKQKAREQEKRAKENAAAAKRLAEIEEAQKSEAEKAADAIRAAQDEANAARLEAQRYRIATELELAAEDVAALEHASSEEGMRAIAERLASKSDARKKQGNVVPREGTSTQPKPDEVREFARNLFARGD